MLLHFVEISYVKSKKQAISKDLSLFYNSMIENVLCTYIRNDVTRLT